jgi:crotonobetainyl-CoA:carnitine CoA-transferase CaiB-like acyl-CoA transferase
MSAQALDGVKVVEFGSYAAGPHIGKMLANYGATVVHVESVSHPDGFRLQYPPFKDGRPGIDASGCFAYFNDSKLGVTVDLKKTQGVDLARRLTDWSDIVIENMRPGVMDRLGLGYRTLQALHPELIMLSTCNMGQTGPRADTPGFGSQLTALAGMCNLTGDGAGPPMLLYGPYIDFIASTLGAAAVLAALEKRRRTGEGSYLDISQYECGLMFLAGPLLAYHDSGQIAERAGNSDPDASPHGAWPCRDAGWLALSCWSTTEFGRLCRAIGHAQLADEPGLNTLPGRQAGAARIARFIADWTREQDAPAAAQVLQRAGVHAHAVSTVADLFGDPQLLARRLWRRRPHAVFGEVACCFPAFELSDTPGEIGTAAPRLGEHNQQVFCDLLGIDPQRYDALRAQGAIG